jgi:hypothetical protein
MKTIITTFLSPILALAIVASLAFAQRHPSRISSDGNGKPLVYIEDWDAFVCLDLSDLVVKLH